MRMPEVMSDTKGRQLSGSTADPHCEHGYDVQEAICPICKDGEFAHRTSKPLASDKKFVERLRRQADDGHGWDKVPEMLRESADRIERLRAVLEEALAESDQDEDLPWKEQARKALRIKP
jgi:hypothetical protein